MWFPFDLWIPQQLSVPYLCRYVALTTLYFVCELYVAFLINIRPQERNLHLGTPWGNFYCTFHRIVIQSISRVKFNIEEFLRNTISTSVLSIRTLLLCSAVLWLETFFPSFSLTITQVNYALQMPLLKRDPQWETYYHWFCC